MRLSNLPDPITRLPSLADLGLKDNNLEVIPENLLFLAGHLKSLDLSHNSIAASSSILGQLTSLESLDLSSNALVGAVPVELLALATSETLTSLWLDNNDLSGSVPEELCPALSLDCIGSGNEFLCGCNCVCTGINASALPRETVRDIKNPASPQGMAFRWVKEDPLLSAYSAWHIFQRFVLASVYYGADGGSWKNNSGWLQYDIDDCQWHQDHAAPCDGNGRYQHLWLQDNNLRALAPEVFLLTTLRSIHLDFVEPAYLDRIPRENIALLTNLELLSLTGIDIIGDIPDEIGLVTSLRHLSLQNCRLEGLPLILRILKPIAGNLKSLDLSRNWMNVLDSSGIQRFTKVESLDLSHNSLFGTIPDGIISLVTAGSLKTLHLDNNRLEGTVPELLCSLGPTNFTFDCDVFLCGCDCSCN
eukprot:Sro1180_g249780.1 Leucine Rich Repeat (418) ;mRNA; r:27489-28742